MKNNLFKELNIPTINAEYFISYDTLDNDSHCFILARKLNDVIEILLQKKYSINSIEDKKQFIGDVNKLAYFFDASVNGL